MSLPIFGTFPVLVLLCLCSTVGLMVNEKWFPENFQRLAEIVSNTGVDNLVAVLPSMDSNVDHGIHKIER